MTSSKLHQLLGLPQRRSSPLPLQHGLSTHRKHRQETICRLRSSRPRSKRRARLVDPQPAHSGEPLRLRSDLPRQGDHTRLAARPGADRRKASPSTSCPDAIYSPAGLHPAHVEDRPQLILSDRPAHLRDHRAGEGRSTSNICARSSSSTGARTSKSPWTTSAPATPASVPA